MKAMSDGGEDGENVYNWQRQVVEEKTEPNSRALFLLYVRDSINKINNHQFRQIENAINVQMQGDVTEESVTGNGNIFLSGSSTINGTAWDGYQQFVEPSFGETVFGNYNTSGGGDGDELLENFSSPYLMPWPQRTAWITVFTLMLLVATVGNTLVAWIVLAHRRMKTVTNYFLVNLSLADLTMSLFNCIFNFTFMLNSHWPFGGVYCTVNNFIANVTVAASVFTLVAISFDRYIAIVYPLRPRMSKCIARIAISLIWLASCILAVPCLLYSQTISHSYPNGEVRIVCVIVWPDGLPTVSQQDFIYNIIFTVLTYLIPVSVMGVCYSRMSYILWRSQSIGELSQRQAESIQSKRKVVRMFIVVVMLFAICWLPYHGYFVYQFIDHQVISYKYVQHIFLSFYWLAMSNAMINPLVYYYMNARFRQYFKTVICQCLCRGRRSSTTCAVTDLVGAPIRLGHTGHRSSPDRSLPPGRSYVAPTAGRSHSRTSSAATSPRRNNHRRRIIRFNTRRLIIFQRITSHNVNQSLEIPLVHRANMLVENQRVPPTTARNILLNKNSETLISHNGVRELVSESPPTNNTSVMLSYL